jgi:hypothetical protein
MRVQPYRVTIAKGYTFELLLPARSADEALSLTRLLVELLWADAPFMACGGTPREADGFEVTACPGVMPDYIIESLRAARKDLTTTAWYFRRIHRQRAADTVRAAKALRIALRAAESNA